MVSDKTPNQHMVSKFLLNQIHIDAICCRSLCNNQSWLGNAK